MNQAKTNVFKHFIFSFLLLFGGLSAAISMNRFDHRAVVAHADSITDLTGCTWVGKDIPNFTTPSGTYNINFTSNGTNFTVFKISSHWAGFVLWYDGTQATEFNSQFYWKNEAYKTIKITGGSAATNANLISWLQNNGTLTQPNVKVTGVELDKGAAEISVGSTVTLTPAVSPNNATNKSVTWSTSDSSVATVTDGVVTGVAEGSATITVTTVDGGFTDTCDITVNASSGGDVNEGLYTTIIVKDTINWNFKSLWLDNFSYADGYKSMRNTFFDNSTFYGDIVSNWTAEYRNGKQGHYYYDTGINLSRGTNSTNTFYIPAWITDFTISVQDDTPANDTYLGYLSDLYSYNGPWITAGDPLGESGLGKTIEIDMNSTLHDGKLSGDVTLKDTQNYSNTVTVNTYYLKSDGPVKASSSVERHQFYLPNVNKVVVDGYATNNKWYSGTTYDASDEFNSILTDSTTNLVSKYEVGSNDSSIEIRFTRPLDWGDNAIALHTWNEGGSTTTWPGYLMTWLWNNDLGEGIFSWSPSFDEPLYGKIILNNNDNGSQTANLDSPSTSKWYYSGDWHDVPTMDIYLYDYDNVYDGNVDLSLSRYGTSFADQVKATQMIDVATNGLIYKATINNRYDRVIFSNDGQDATDYLTTTGNYCYVKGNNIDNWWDNINYVFAHNFSQHTMLMDTIETSDHSVTPCCSERYNNAKTHFNALMDSGYGEYVLVQLNNNFADAMERFAAWASANGEGIDNTDGRIYTYNAILLSVDTNNTILILAVVSTSALLAAGGFLLIRRRRQR